MGLVYTIPSKCFIAGEYLAMSGGPCLLVSVEPHFELRVENGSGKVSGLPPGSPARRFMDRHGGFFRSLDVQFFDPHAGAGGWGASTAQYLGVFAARAWAGAANDESGRDLDMKTLISEYQTDAWDGVGRAPSGADLLAQSRGGWVHIERSAGMIQKSTWPFEDLEPYLIRTGEKITTHEHLRTLGEFPTESLVAEMTRIREAWSEADADKFCAGIADFGANLRTRGWVTETTRNLLHDLLWLDGVRAAKGCGAMGADIVLALVDRRAARAFERHLTEKTLSFVKPREVLAPGLGLRVEARVDFPEVLG